MFTLTEKQKEIINSPAKVKLVMGGTRCGKTTTAIMNLWENLKKYNGRALFLVKNDKELKLVSREIKHFIPIEDVVILNKECLTTKLKTKFGGIYISTELIPQIYFNIITIDNASDNKYANEEIFKYSDYVYMTGLLPMDMKNDFFKLWLKYLFANDSKFKSFRMSTWDNPQMAVHREQHEERLKNMMSPGKYAREYECISDYI